MPLHCDEITGSSPHVRGAHGYRFDAEKPWGIIPACAGSTGFSTDEKLHLRDHPRMCGEHVGHATCPFGDWGSSPHVRGAPRCGIRPQREYGIIPACAGSTAMRSRRATYGRDHPRMCGEHSNILDMSKLTAGSSPHVRGALAHYDDPFHMGGIIPACAGSTCVISHVVEKAWDHPRMCGEHRGIRGRVVVRLGSSPHVRGAHCIFHYSFPPSGIIPACAGSTGDAVQGFSAYRDHPRMCGEHLVIPRS